MTDALAGFGETIQFAVVSKTAVDYEVTETLASVAWITGVKQPLPPQALKIKPEGQRSWKWWSFWTNQSLKVDDEIQDSCKRRYKVMEKSDWSEGGYFHYELTEKAVDA
jgi:hypothetical protein